MYFLVRGDISIILFVIVVMDFSSCSTSIRAIFIEEGIVSEGIIFRGL